VAVRVSDADVPATDAKPISYRLAFASECDLGFTRREPLHVDVGPRDASRPSRAEGFHDGFFCGKPAGQKLNPERSGASLRLLTLGKDSIGEPLTVTIESRANALDLDQVNAVADDGHPGNLANGGLLVARHQPTYLAAPSKSGNSTRKPLLREASMLRLRSISVAVLAGAVALGCSDSNQPVGPSDQSDNSSSEPAMRAAAQTGADDPIALAKSVPGFGGFFIDEQGTPTIYLKDTGKRAAAEQALSPWLGSHGVRGAQMKVLHADFDWADLERWHAKGSPAALAVKGAVFAGADHATNRLRIGIERGASAGEVRQALTRLGIPASAVTVEVTEPVVRLATLQESVRPVIAGVQINFPGFLCSIGFNATRSGTSGFVTASHCTNTQGGTENTPYWQPLQSTSPIQIATEAVDPVYTSGGSCPAGRLCRSSDASFARYINNTQNTLGRIARTSSTRKQDLTIIGNWTITADAPSACIAVGTIVNKVGRTTGWSQGRVTATCVDVNVGGTNITQLRQTLVQATVGAGDSGSDVFAINSGTNVTLEGVLWGGSGSHTFVFSPLANVKQELGALTTH